MTFGLVGIKRPSLAAFVDAVPLLMKRESLHERFTAKAAAFMERCVKSALSSKPYATVPIKSQYLSHFHSIQIVDSSSWDVQEQLQNVLPGSGGAASKANCKIQVTYDYLSGCLNFFEALPGISPDNRYSRNLPNHLKSNELLIVDLGYFRLQTFLDISRKGAFFLSRFLSNTALFDPDNGERITLYDTLKKLHIPLYQRNVIMGGQGQPKVACRIICMKVSEKIANERRRKLKATAIKKGRQLSKTFLEMAGWTILVTNIPETWLPATNCWHLYSLRWQIELLFKQLKSILRIHRSDTGKEYRLKCELYGKMIVAIIIHRIHAEANAKLWNMEFKEISMDKLYKRVQERSFMFMKMLKQSVKRAGKYLLRELNCILKNCRKLLQKSRQTSLERLEFGDYMAAIMEMEYP